MACQLDHPLPPRAQGTRQDFGALGIGAGNPDQGYDKSRAETIRQYWTIKYIMTYGDSMARPRTFDETAVLDAAAREFRVHGFAETSTEQLCEAASVRRSSLYNTFASKDELFVRALEHYVATTGSAHEAVLTDEDLHGAARLQGLMDLILDEEREAAAHGHAAGCMVVSARMAPDLSAKNEKVKNLLDRALERQLSLIEQTIRLGQLDGSLKPGNAAPDTARTMVALISGLRVLAQAGSTHEELRRVVTLALDGLRA